MKKYVVFAAICTAMIACNSSDSNKGGEEKPADNATPAPTASAHEKGLEMIGALDCTTCHK
ncbi:MAG TPA: cytochrome c class I, partial [Niastella sp.]